MILFKEAKYEKNIISTIAFVLLTVSTVSAFTPFASRYITSYDAFLVDKGNGKIEIWFDVTGVTRMDEIGAQKIELREKMVIHGERLLHIIIQIWNIHIC